MNCWLILCIGLLLPTVARGAELPAPPASDQAQAIRDNNTFAVELYTQLRQLDGRILYGNLLFSPEGISTALAMAYAGARGETATETAKVLHFTLPQERLQPAMGALLKDLNAPRDGYRLKVSNGLWTQPSAPFCNDFIQRMKDIYGSFFSFGVIDTRQVTPPGELPVRQTIDCVEHPPESKNLIQNGKIHPVALAAWELHLGNAIHFKGDWQTRFEKADTQDEDFYAMTLPPWKKMHSIRVSMMHRTGTFNYLAADSFQALEIPYQANEFSMVLFLPRAMDGLPAFEESLTPASLQQWLNQLRPFSEVRLAMPKFKLNALLGRGLDYVLSTMGMRQAFAPRVSDFSGITGDRLLHPFVTHEAYADIDEGGTEAATAAGVITKTPTNPVFRADHPFLFLIRDNRSGGILLMGRVLDPLNVNGGMR